MKTIVVRRNGKPIVIRGWRAWLLIAAMWIVFWLALAAFVFVVIGAAITIGMLLLLLLPAAIIVGFVASLSKWKRT